MTVAIPIWVAWLFVGLHVIAGLAEWHLITTYDYAKPKLKSRGADTFGLVICIVWIAAWLHWMGVA